MNLPVNLVLELRTKEEYDCIQDTLASLRESMAVLDDKSRVEMNLALLDRITMRLTDSKKEARVLIHGQQVAIGTTEDMDKRYKTECAMVSGANIVLQEWRDGDYKSTRSRRLQKF